ncbi:MAG: uroporphyrinogen-III C-methyltransferase [Alphaproteobacteria bacterium]|nr:uroporphyrinogen-III C-methyltransferase [Alphaproteobacteria bacterium]
MGYAPLFFKLGPQTRFVIIGGGHIAFSKSETLIALGAQLQVVGKTILPELKVFVEGVGGSVIEADYAPDYLKIATIVIAATDDAALNETIYRDAKAQGKFVNVVDTPDLCDFIFPATIKRGDIQVAISSAGISPSLARAIKRKIEYLLPWNIDALGQWIKEKRDVVKKNLKGIQARRLFWDEVLDGGIAQEVVEGNNAKAETLFAQALSEAPAASRAALYLVGAGPGHPDYITVRGTQLLGQADVVLYDRLIAPDLLERYARREATKIAVGKSADHHIKTQDAIAELIETHLRKNKIVVRLKGGDPGIYAHAAEEMDIARKLGVPYQIVPGITAALGCAAASGFPLTERNGASAVRLLTYYDETLYSDDFWKSLQLSRDETLVFYMTTRKRNTLIEKLLSIGYKPTTPAVIIEQGTTPNHAEYEATLGTFIEIYGDTNFITPTLLVIGDVVRWRATHSWREPAAVREDWFAKNTKEVADVT